MQDKFLQFLGLSKKAKKLIEGYNKCEEFIKKGNIKLLILSQDVSENTKDKFEKLSINYNVPIRQCYLKEELGYALGREEISVLGVTDENFCKKLIELLNENKNI